MGKTVAPAIRETAFNCPHCDALTTQYWHQTYARQRATENPLPVIWQAENIERLRKAVASERDPDTKHKLEAILLRAERLILGAPEFGDRVDPYVLELDNVSVSSCFNCKQLSIWIYDRLIYPVAGEAPTANVDLPAHIRRDYDEASVVLNASPRGAAALLRLCVQLLCKELGEPGKNINDDIAALVSKGLDVRIQQALDIVRVVGNNAVHPGQIDLKDDRATALSLFQLVNVITEKMISEPRHIDAVFASLPEDAKKAIKKRDAVKP